MAHDSDNAWKDILHSHFRGFLELFFPRMHGDIDWRRPFEFLDKELEPLIPEALKGKALADKLVRVQLTGADPTLIFIHVEVQGQADPSLSVRMLRYNLLFRERYGEDVVSLVVLTDARARFRPSTYEYSRWGFQLRMTYPVVKLLDFRGREAELERHPNIFAIVVLATLAKIEARTLKGLFDSKRCLVRLLYRRGHTRKEIRDLLRFLDWILRLPRELERGIIDETRTLEGQRNMPYLSNLERWSIEKGLKRGERIGVKKGKQKGKQEGKKEGKKEGQRTGERLGLLEAIALGLELRFGSAGLAVLPSVQRIEDPSKLRRLVGVLRKTRSLEGFLGAAARK